MRKVTASSKVNKLGLALLMCKTLYPKGSVEGKDTYHISYKGIGGAEDYVSITFGTKQVTIDNSGEVTKTYKAPIKDTSNAKLCNDIADNFGDWDSDLVCLLQTVVIAYLLQLDDFNKALREIVKSVKEAKQEEEVSQIFWNIKMGLSW